jgi:methyl-accepting chemotaxis protein
MITLEVVVRSLIDMTKDLSKSQLSRVEAGGKIISSVAQIIGSLTGVLSNIDFSGDPQKIRLAGSFMSKVLPSLNDLLANLGSSIGIVLTNIENSLKGYKLGRLKMIERKMQTIAKVIGVVSSFSNLIKDSDMTSTSASTMQTVSQTAPNLFESFNTLATSFGDFIKEGGKLNEFIDKINTVKSIDPTMYDSLKVTLTNIKDIFELTEKTMTDYLSLSSVSSKISAGMTDNLNGSITSMASICQTLNNNSTGFPTAIANINELSNVIDTFASSYSEGMYTYVSDVADNLNELDNILSRLEIDPLDVTIDRLSEKLQVHKDNVRIENKPINVSLTMNVTFKAEEFVRDIFKVANNQVKAGKGDVLDFIKHPDDEKYNPKY